MMKTGIRNYLKTWKKPVLGYGFAALTGKIIYHLNEIFFPEFATIGRLVAWVLIMGTLFTLFLKAKD